MRYVYATVHRYVMLQRAGSRDSIESRDVATPTRRAAVNESALTSSQWSRADCLKHMHNRYAVLQSVGLALQVLGLYLVGL